MYWARAQSTTGAAPAGHVRYANRINREYNLRVISLPDGNNIFTFFTLFLLVTICFTKVYIVNYDVDGVVRVKTADIHRVAYLQTAPPSAHP